MKQKGFTPIIIILLIAIIGVLGYFSFKYFRITNQPSNQLTVSSPTPTATTDPTANWKTYTNTKVGFSVKYPDRYSQPGLPSGGSNSQPILATGTEDNTDIIFGQSSLDSMDLVVFPFTGTLDQLKDYTKGPITFPSDPYNNYLINNNFQVGNVAAKWYQDATNTGGFMRIYFVNKGYGFILSANSNHDMNEVNQILSTFKFTESTPSASPVSSASPMYAKDGESCGSLAGAAGNAQCAPGLTCRNQDPNNYNIGTCAK